MIKTLKMSLEIDIVYSINSFIYMLLHFPILKDMLGEDAYDGKELKFVVRIISIIFAIVRVIIYRLLYFFIIYFLASKLSKNISNNFIHIYFIFTIIGIFINNKLLNTSLKKYVSVILLKMDAKEYINSYLLFDLVKSLILNSLCFYIMGMFVTLKLKIILSLILISFCGRIIGEALNICFYRKYGYVFISNTRLYFIILGIFLSISMLPYIGIVISNKIIIGSTIFFILGAILGYRYLIKVDDYKLIYKKLNTKNRVMNSEEAQAYSKQAMVDVKNKDKNIDIRKIKNKKGYDKFNTIFFERHKEILLRSSKKYALILGVIYIILGILMIKSKTYNKNIYEFLTYGMGWFVFITYFINRGAIVTQAMYFNCDHAMLAYNFYKEAKVLLNLFKKRLLTVVKVNLIPAVVMGVGNCILLYLAGEGNYLVYIMMFVFIIVLNIFFSVHYLVIYYLLQPYDKEMKMKKASYSLVVLVTYLICYSITELKVSIIIFSILGIICTSIYVVVGLILVYKYSPKTFKIN